MKPFPLKNEQVRNPIVSVCIPVYNGEAFILQAIESVLSQTFSAFELIILDDCSIDQSVQRIKAFKDPRIRFIQNKKNLGFEGNWNKALAESCGTYIKILPQDDILYPTCLEKQVSIFEQARHKDIVMVSCHRDIIDAKSRKILKRGPKIKGNVATGISIIQQCVRAGTNLIGEPGAVLFKRESLGLTGGFDGTNPFMIDLDLWARILLQGDIYMIPEPLCRFRVSTNSASVTMVNSHAHQFIQFINHLKQDPKYELSSYDYLQGQILAYFNALGRYLFYTYIFNL